MPWRRRNDNRSRKEVAALARINYRLDARISELEGQIRVRDERIADFQNQLNERHTKPKVSAMNDGAIKKS
jgi:hypothetical protein